MADKPPTWRGTLAAIHAAYSGEKDDRLWFESVIEAAALIGHRPYGYVLDLKEGAPQLLALCGDPELAAQLGRAAMFAFEAVPFAVVRAYHSIDPVVDTSTERERLLSERRGLAPDWLTTACQGNHPIDSLGVVAGDPDGTHALLLAFHEIGTQVPQRLREPLELLSAHLSAALRLRRALATDDVVDAVLSPDGRVLDAKGEAKDPEMRTSLAAAALRMDKAKLRETSPEEAVELWNAMIEGKWTVVENVESDGKRLMLARRNPPDVQSMTTRTTLTPAEAQVASYAAHGHSYKLIAYELGLPLSTVAFHLDNALAKLGFPSRTALIASRDLKG